MTPKQEQFVKEYMVDFNATQAAIRAGYAESGARQEGSRLLARPEVQEAVERAKSSRQVGTGRGRFVCQNCIFINANSMQCRVGRPSIMADGVAAWPRVDLNDWCGEGDWGAAAVEPTPLRVVGNGGDDF